MKKLLLLCLLLLGLTQPAGAVLNEKDLAHSLRVLRAELTQAYEKQKESMSRMKLMNQQQHQQMLDIMQKSSQVSLMIYSQKDDYTFDLTYACNEATEQYRKFQTQRLPYDRIEKRLQTELQRYDGLIRSLQQLPPRAGGGAAPPDTATAPPPGGAAKPVRPDTAMKKFELSAAAQRDRDICLAYAQALRQNIVDMQTQIAQDSESYTFLGQHLRELNDYAKQRYHDIQQNIFRNNGDSYLKTLRSFGRNFRYAERDVEEKYSSSSKEFRGVHSEWRGPVVWGYVTIVVFYLVLSVVLSVSLVNVARRKMRIIRELPDADYRQVRPALFLTSGFAIFAVSIMVARVFLTHNFYVMATGLLVEYAWLLVAIFASLLIRLKKEQMKPAYRAYTPIVLMGLVIIIFRIVFIPNRLVSLLLPPLSLAFTVWQWFGIRRTVKCIPRTDAAYTWISLGVMAFSTVASWAGYNLLAVQLFIWWLFQLTAIQAITLAFVLLDRYEDRFLKKRLERHGATHAQLQEATRTGNFITLTWFFDFVHMAVVPVAAAASVLYCIYLAADVFDLADTCVGIFITPFLNVEGVIRLSLFGLVIVASLFFIFRYMAYLAKALYRHIRLQALMRKSGGKRKVRTNEINLTLGYNVIAILVWGIYVVTVIVLLRIPKSGISIVTAGLATGIGFAMKDILNNFFYGIQLMAGRLRVGDWIECDGVQGKVDSITYQSTQITTTDDCVMAFLNSTLFSKNFKNLTRNHSYELVKIPVGVAYGTDVERVRALLSEAVMRLQQKDAYGRNLIDPRRRVLVNLDGFGDSSVDLVVASWVLVAGKVAFLAKAKEIIYNTLNENNIEIPFPQRDVHMKP